MIYLDMDGVLADFDGELLSRGVRNVSQHSPLHIPEDQWTQEQKELDARVKVEMEKPDFWLSIPVMRGAEELLATCRNIRPTKVLTATPRSTKWRDRIALHKRVWARQQLNIDYDDVITCLRHEKKDYAKAGYILIDDMPSNCQEWWDAGGMAILFTSAAEAIEKLKEIT